MSDPLGRLVEEALRQEATKETMPGHEPDTTLLAKQSKATIFGSVVGGLLANVTQGAAYALGALLVWDWFFR